MKYIKKGNEPNSLKQYRETTENASYKGFVDTDQQLKKSLLKEQKYICAYCMGSIDENHMSIEHYISQKKHKDSMLSEDEHKNKELDYKNMLGVCLNKCEHCDKSRGNKPIRVLNPLYKNCERKLTYSTSGEILAISNDTDVHYDINDLFRLNCEKLVDARSSVVNNIMEQFRINNPKGTWTKKMLLEQKVKYDSSRTSKGEQKYYTYCGYISWYFDELSKCPKYK